MSAPYPSITVILRHPFGKTTCHEVQLSEDAFGDLVNPLPRGHDCPFDPRDIIEAEKQRRNRHVQAEHLGKLLAQHILQCSQELDTIKGYPRDEYRRQMARPHRFSMVYEDVEKMRSLYPFLGKSSETEVLGLLEETTRIAPEDTEFASACRLELMWRSKEKERLSHGQ